MSNGNISESKLKSSTAPFVHPKMESCSQYMGAGLAASAQAVWGDGDVRQHTMQIYEMDGHKGKLARLITKMDVWCAISAPASGRSPTSITIAIDQYSRSICGLVVPSDHFDAASTGTQFNKENAHV